ncbi:MAG: MerR family transcriptional regulator [Propionibacteriales bacterium]|nr:MerR family transcriptional regulator [Propionibacteriales bacterium]
MTDPTRGVFAISVAAELAGTTVQNLRAYERSGLVEPGRTDGGSRRYSQNDVDRLLSIREMLDAGLNSVGIERVLGLQAEVLRLQAELVRLGHPASATPRTT